MRDHRKLKAFELAHRLAVEVYRLTSKFPKSELYGISAQMRRAAVSVPSNIVEGSSRSSLSEYIRFLEIAHGSSRELRYQIELSYELNLAPDQNFGEALDFADQTAKTLSALISSLRPQTSSLRSS